MSNRMKKLVSLLAVAVMAVSVFAGCGNTDDKESSSTPSGSGGSVVESGSSESEEPKEFSYPYEPTTELTINFANYMSDRTDDDPYGGTEIFDCTGVILSSNGVSQNSSSEDFLLMLVSGNLPDIISNNFASTYKGGAAGAIDEGYIIDLNEYAEYMPNYLAFLEENQAIKEHVTTDDGRIWCFASIEDPGVPMTSGITVRKDVLDDLGLAIPTTVADFYNCLKTVKEKTDMIPFSSELRWMWNTGNTASIANGFDTAFGWYSLDGKKVQFGFVTDNFKAWLQEMNKWWNEGLIDPDFATVKKGDVRGKLSNGTLFAALHSVDNSATSLAASTVDGAEYFVLQPLTSEGGSVRNFNTKLAEKYEGYQTIGSGNFSVSTDCKNIEAAMRYCDFMYTELGMNMYRYGTEGVHWEYDANGEVALTEFMTNHPSGRSAGDVRWDIAKVTQWCGVGGGSLLYKGDWEKATMERLNALESGITYVGADVSSFMTDDERAEYTTIITTFMTYAEENITGLIMGTKSFDDWDKIVNDANNVHGIARCTELMQATWDKVIAQ